MKILKVFGVVVAIHAVVGLFVVVIPGCRTASRPVSVAPAPEAGASVPSVSYPGGNTGAGVVTPSLNGADINPGTSSATPVVAFNGDSSAQHYNPTRPGTPVAGALQGGDVSGVTPASTYKVVSNDSLWKIAKKHGIGIDNLAKANNLRPNSPLKVGQKLIIPGKPSAPAASGATSGRNTYTVKAGESLGTIAHKNGATVTELRSLNPQLKNDVVRVGRELTVPGSAAKASSAAAAPAAPVTASGTTSAPVGSIEHIVKPGEGLGQISKKYGVPQREIATLNNIANPTSLRAGQKLIIPGVKTPGTVAPIPSVQIPVEQSPVAPSAPVDTPASEVIPVTTPLASDVPPPPVVKVEETAPVAPSK